MRREQFEIRIKDLLPDARANALAVWVKYAHELDRDGVEMESDFYDATYVELSLIKEHQGEEIAAKLFNFGEQFTFNYFELRGAASKLAEGWTLEKIREYTLENGCDAAPEEAEESQAALRAFQASDQEANEMRMM